MELKSIILEYKKYYISNSSTNGNRNSAVEMYAMLPDSHRSGKKKGRFSSLQSVFLPVDVAKSHTLDL